MACRRLYGSHWRAFLEWGGVCSAGPNESLGLAVAFSGQGVGTQPNPPPANLQHSFHVMDRGLRRDTEGE